MGWLEETWKALPDFIPFVATLAAVIGALALLDWLLKRRRSKHTGEFQFGRQITMLLLSIVGLVIIILALPVEQATRNQLIGLVGVALTAVIALSSTTFVANAMAGILLRSMSRFKPGDFIRVDEQLGRVTERGLFHTEVQTEDRDLATFPNFYLVSNPLKVVRSSGTIISATVSLGYDVPNDTVRSLLTKAADDSGLADAFTHVLELGDFSVTYRVAGFLEDVTQLITARSKLRIAMIDELHGAGIEIVSPTFMVQRPQTDGKPVLAQRADAREETGVAAEAVVFDKAEAAAKVEALRQERETLQADVEHMKGALPDADEGAKARLDRSLRFREQRLESIDQAIEQAREALEEED